MLSGLVIACIVCFTRASIEGFTNFLCRAVLQKSTPSLTAIVDVLDECDHYSVAKLSMSMLKTLPWASLLDSRSIFKEIADSLPKSSLASEKICCFEGRSKSL